MPDLGIKLEASTLERFWTMLAHHHGQTWNSSELARSFGVGDLKSLLHHPKLGASFEGFALGEVVRRLRTSWRDCYFWATHQGAELDLLVVRGARRHGFEFKHTIAPQVTKSMSARSATSGLANPARGPARPRPATRASRSARGAPSARPGTWGAWRGQGASVRAVRKGGALG